MDCKQASRIMQEHIDGRSSRGDSASLREHVESCPGCRERLLFMQDLAGSLNALGDVTSPPWFTERVMERARRERTQDAVSESRSRSRGWFSVLCAWTRGAAVMATVVLLFGFLNLFITVDSSSARVLSTDPTVRISVSGRDVSVPSGVVVRGNLTVLDGDVTIDGRVEGDVRVIRGSVTRGSGSHVSGRVVLIDSPLAQARDALLGSIDWFLSVYRQFTYRVIGR